MKKTTKSTKKATKKTTESGIDQKTPNPIDNDREKIGMPRISDQQYVKTLPDGSKVDFTDLANFCKNLDKFVLIKDELLQELGFKRQCCGNYGWEYTYNTRELFMTNRLSETSESKGFVVRFFSTDIIVAKTPQELRTLIEMVEKNNKRN